METINKQDFGTFVLHVEENYPFVNETTLVQPIDVGEDCYIIVVKNNDSVDVFYNEIYLQSVVDSAAVKTKLLLDLAVSDICSANWHPVKKAIMLMVENNIKLACTKDDAKRLLVANT